MIIRQKYQKADKPKKTKILDEIEADSNMNRKPVIRLQNKKFTGRKKSRRDEMIVEKNNRRKLEL